MEVGAPVANVEMARAWDGEEGDDWTENAERYEATGRYLGVRFDEATAIEPDDRVLDIGCGTGKSTRDAARRAAWVLGVDLSSRMLARARERAAEEGLTNIDFLQADAQVHPFEPGAFDIAISDFGAMFFADPATAFGNIGSALRRGGRLCTVAWRTFEENEWLVAIRSAVAAGRSLPSPPAGMPGPFGLADRDQDIEILEAAGFLDVEVTPLDEPMWLGVDADDAYGFVSGLGIVKGLTGDLDARDRKRALSALRDLVERNSSAEGVTLGSAAWLIAARRP